MLRTPVQTDKTVTSVYHWFGGVHKAAYSHPTLYFIYENKIPTTMAKESTRMPMGSAGITSYFDEYRSKIEFKPGHVIIMAVVIILIIVALHLWASTFLAA